MAQDSKSELRAWLSAIGTLSAAVNSDRDLQSLLNLVAETAKDLLGLSYCAVMLPDPNNEFLSVAAASALPEQYAAQAAGVRVEVRTSGDAPASRAFRTSKPAMVANIADEPDHDWTELVRVRGYQSILAVPLLYGPNVLGTVNSYKETPHDFSDEEIEQLTLLAEHATIALTSARILDDIRDKHRLIVRSEEIHQRLLRVAVQSGGVSGIAAALNDLLGCSVVIRDTHGATLAAEPAAAAQQLGEDPAPVVKRRNGTPGLVTDVGTHVMADVVLEGIPVATVWLLDKAESLDPLAIRAMEHASVVLSLELLRERTAARVEQTLRGELLADLLAGADPDSSSIRARARLMDHRLGMPQQLLVAAPFRARAGSRSIVEDPETAQRAATEATRLTSHLRPRPLIAAVQGIVVALWPSGPDGASAGEQVLRRAIASATSGSTATVALSGLDANGIVAAYRSARGALAFAGISGLSRAVVSLDDLGAAGLLLQFAEPDELRRYAARTLGVLSRYDVEHGADLLKTLRAYLGCDLERRATAELLVLHPNTVSQRLRRIETLTGLSLRSPQAVIEFRTALMLTDVAGAVSEVGALTS